MKTVAVEGLRRTLAADEPFVGLWVYAGPMPERMVVAGLCTTAAGNP